MNTIQKNPFCSTTACHVLVVEDNVLNQKITKILLEDLGCIVDIAAEEKTALEMIALGEYDLIFMDIGLSDTDGVVLAQQIKNNLKTQHIPIVFLTAHAMGEELERCKKAALDGVLTKPVSSEHLKNILIKFCSKK